MSAEEIKKFYEKFNNDTAKMKKQTPQVASGFMNLFGKVMKDGTISLKQKELIAISIAVSCYCGPCIKLHVKKCLNAGATREEILDAASVAVMMSGGPAFTHLPEVIDALDANEA